MSKRPSMAAVLACLLAAGCSGASAGRRDDGGPDLGVRVWAPPIVRWEAGRPREVEFSIENLTLRTVTVPATDPANARVDVYAGPESIRLCGVAPRQGPAPRGAETIALAPGDRISVRVDLDAACAAVPPGDYRYEVSYRLPDTGRSGVVAGTLPTRYGQVLVAAGSAQEPARRLRARSGRAEVR